MADKTDFGKFVLERNESLIELADTKASIIIGIDGVILALLFESGRSSSPYPLLGTVILLAFSGLFAFLAIKPRIISGTPDTKIFYGAITKKTRETFVTEFSSANEDEVLKDLANNIFTLAAIQKLKFRYLKLSIWLLILAFIPLSLMLFMQSAVASSSLGTQTTFVDQASYVAIAAGFLATFFGVILGFELERRRDSKNRKERLVGALEMIKDEIERNIGLCEQIQNELTKDPGFVQYYLLKTTTWTSVASVLVDLKSPKLAKQIASEYFDYEHLNRRINARFEFFKTGDPSNVIHARAFANITGSVIVGVKDLQVSSKNVVNAIKTQLDQMK